MAIHYILVLDHTRFDLSHSFLEWGRGGGPGAGTSVHDDANDDGVEADGGSEDDNDEHADES